MATEDPLDPRSTGRKRGRAALEAQGRPYWCRSTMDGGFKTETIRGQVAGCGRSPVEEDAPGGCWPGMSQLQVNHINKNVLDNDTANLEWVCPQCHKLIDSQTEKGVSTGSEDMGYGGVLPLSSGTTSSQTWPIPGNGIKFYWPGVRVIPDSE